MSVAGQESKALRQLAVLGSANSHCRRDYSLHCLAFRSLAIRNLVRRGPADFDAALEYGAVFDANARRLNVADHRTVSLDVHTVAGIHVAAYFAVDGEFPRRDSRG